MKVFALLFKLRVGEAIAGLGEGDDLVLCTVGDDKACTVNTEFA